MTRVRELTDRQVEILVRLSRGDAYKTIARHLRLSPATVSYHVAKMQTIFNARSLPALVALAIVAGILTSDQWPIEATGQLLVDPDK